MGTVVFAVQGPDYLELNMAKYQVFVNSVTYQKIRFLMCFIKTDTHLLLYTVQYSSKCVSFLMKQALIYFYRI